MKINIGNSGMVFGLFLVFLTLKFCKVIAWSWWWVTSPLWGGLVLILPLMLVVVILIGIIELIRAQED